MEKVTVEDMGPNQCEVKIGKYRVAYVCYGKGMPINWLPKACSGIELTDGEKLSAAKQVRELMATRNQQKNSVLEELEAISRPKKKPETSLDGTDQRSNTQREKPAPS